MEDIVTVNQVEDVVSVSITDEVITSNEVVQAVQSYTDDTVVSTDIVEQVNTINQVDTVVSVAVSDGGITGTNISIAEDQNTPKATIEYLQAEVGGKEYRFASYPEFYLPFSIGITGVPSSSSVYSTQDNFTIGSTLVSGTLTDLESISTSVGSGTIVDGAATFNGGDYQALGSYTATVTANGESEDPEPVTQASSASGGWSRYEPAYWVSQSAAPTALPASNLGIVFGGTAVSGTVGEGIYLITTQSGFRFDVGPYEINENLVGTITSQTDTAGTSRDFNVFEMGDIGVSGSATFTLR